MPNKLPKPATESAPSKTPSKNGSNGQRDARGRFVPGCEGGHGNPYAKQVHTFRSAIVQAVTPADIQAVIQALLKAAKEGDVAAAKLFLERTVGAVKQEIKIEEGGELQVVERIVRVRSDRVASDAG